MTDTESSSTVLKNRSGDVTGDPNSIHGEVRNRSSTRFQKKDFTFSLIKGDN